MRGFLFGHFGSFNESYKTAKTILVHCYLKTEIKQRGYLHSTTISFNIYNIANCYLFLLQAFVNTGI